MLSFLDVDDILIIYNSVNNVKRKYSKSCMM